MKIFSWNVNGLRAVLKKGAFQSFIAEHQPDILCLQETKAQPGQAVVDLPDYTEIWHSAERPGYSGTAIFTKIPVLATSVASTTGVIDPISTSNTTSTTPIDALLSPEAPSNSTPDLPKFHIADCADQFGDPCREGRVLTAEFEHFYLVDVYTPNSKRALERLALRHDLWDPAILHYLQRLEQTKPVIICGDFNAAHTEIDLARPKENRHNAGFTDEEREGITNLLAAGFTDTFRTLHPDQRRYTWWSHWGHARENNVGWRIDYFFISKSLERHLQAAEIYESVTGSDHCPISITLDFEAETSASADSANRGQKA